MLSWPNAKDPDARLDYQFDWSLWLQVGETITDSEFLVESSEAITTFAIEPSTQEIDGGLTTFWATGGVATETVEITNRITTSAGRIDDKTSRLRVRER